MGKIEFDAAAADAVIRAATSAEDELRAQAGARRSAVEDAAADFSGTYADRFTESALAESADRGKLASVLNDLAGQVRDAKAAAEAEEERLDALDAWNEAERNRQQAAATSLIAMSTLPPLAIRAPKPSEVAVQPPAIHAAFTPRERSRSGGGTGQGRSSADPARLRGFSTVSTANDVAAEAKAVTLAVSWKAFTASCSWVRIDGCTFLTGFERFLEENRADAVWIDRIADAFERAGSDRSLKNTAIDKMTDDKLVRNVERLFAKGLTPTEVAATSVLNALGNLEDVGEAVLRAEAEAAWPYVQDAAAVAGNVFASMGNAMVHHPDEIIELLGGLATMVGGAAMEGGGVALDITGVGAIAGVPLNISGAAVMAAGATAAAAGASQLGVHAMTDDRVSPNRTDHVEQAKKDPNGPNENHPGRNNKGEYRSEGNDKARADSAQKEAQGLKQYEEQRGVDVDVTRVRASQDGADRVRYYDGLVKKADGTYEGIEVKSGTSKDASQEAFDNGVSYDKPAYATLRGERIKITSVAYEHVE
ncbi:hypothetical protein DEJ24_10335 [Curtobacterium sp. MCPF17_001]|uniref:hypothetical protein n=1 Tax=Curtobacterium sp. MCPF17_001 TaxID=2175651 RepID=UPI000DA70429|nr:hypothetical protein [Curtobacterium sp. MCPF17_001]PZE58462.1 hypothetical protein DEJ24_10335 [Curtobacterium sp. MCPF17_001]